MLVVNIYRWRDDSHDVESGRRIMEAFAARGQSPDEVAHYVFADGTGGVIISDGEDSAWAYRNALDFAEFLDLSATSAHIAVSLEDALPAIADRLGG